MNKRVVFFLIIIGVALISACSSKGGNSVEKLPGTDLPTTEFNTKIMLEANPGMPQVHKNGDTLVFLIRNRSSNTIAFAQDFGVKIIKKQGTTWEPAKNKMGYPEGENLLPTNAADPTGLALFVFPDLGELKGSTDVRIVVVGHVKDKPTEQVGAYIDILYNP